MRGTRVYPHAWIDDIDFLGTLTREGGVGVESYGEV